MHRDYGCYVCNIYRPGQGEKPKKTDIKSINQLTIIRMHEKERKVGAFNSEHITSFFQNLFYLRWWTGGLSRVPRLFGPPLGTFPPAPPPSDLLISISTSFKRFNKSSCSSCKVKGTTSEAWQRSSAHLIAYSYACYLFSIPFYLYLTFSISSALRVASTRLVLTILNRSLSNESRPVCA